MVVQLIQTPINLFTGIDTFSKHEHDYAGDSSSDDQGIYRDMVIIELLLIFVAACYFEFSLNDCEYAFSLIRIDS
jgi:hypothetical protein